MYRAGIWDGKWTGKDGKTGKRDLGSKDGKVGRDMGLFSRFPVHFPFFFKPVYPTSLCSEYSSGGILNAQLRLLLVSFFVHFSVYSQIHSATMAVTLKKKQKESRQAEMSDGRFPRRRCLFLWCLFFGFLLSSGGTFTLSQSTQQWIAQLEQLGDASFDQPITAVVAPQADETESSSRLLKLPVLPKPNPFPPVEQVVEWIQDPANHTAAQFVMDLAIIGFAKCGTSTMSKYSAAQYSTAVKNF
jgi:hypothetical protein